MVSVDHLAGLFMVVSPCIRLLVVEAVASNQVILNYNLMMSMQAALLKEYPNKMLVTVTQSVFSTLQLFVVAVVAERDISRWKHGLDISLLAVLYNVIRTSFSFNCSY